MEGIPSAGPTSTSQLPTVPQFRRLKYLWRALLISNFALGAYLFSVPKTKDVHVEGSNATKKTSSTPIKTTTILHEEPEFTLTAQSGQMQQPIPKHQQRGIFGWLKSLG